MPWFPIYATDSDFDLLFGLLSEDPEAAFIVPDGANRWKAVSAATYQGASRYCIWHVPSGPLPLLSDSNTPEVIVADPWSGWQEVRGGADPSSPYFGPGHPGIVWLNSRPKARDGHGIGISSFEWIGNHYRIIGSPAPAATEKWWKRFGRRVRKLAVLVPRSGALDGPGKEIWALPSALQAIQSGAARASNP